MRTSVLTLTAASLVIAACSGGDDADPTVAPTLADTTTTTVDATTSTTTTASTTPPTLAPTTDQPAQQQAVIDAVSLSFETFALAKMDPTSDSRLDAALAATTGPARDFTEARIENMRTLGQVSRVNPAAPAYFELDVPTLSVGASTATIQVCDVDSNILVEIGAGPGGIDAIVDETVTARVLTAFLIRVDGVWLLDRTETVDEYPGAVSCP